MTEQGNKSEPLRVRISFNPDQLKKFLKSKDIDDGSFYSEVSKHSRDYMKAFRLNPDDVQKLKQKQVPSEKDDIYADDLIKESVIKLEIEGKKFGILAKNHPSWHKYGRDGEYMLMAVSNDDSLNKFESLEPWSLIISVGEEWHRKILQAVKLSSQKDKLSAELFGFLKK